MVQERLVQNERANPSDEMEDDEHRKLSLEVDALRAERKLDQVELLVSKMGLRGLSVQELRSKLQEGKGQRLTQSVDAVQRSAARNLKNSRLMLPTISSAARKTKRMAPPILKAPTQMTKKSIAQGPTRSAANLLALPPIENPV